MYVAWCITINKPMKTFKQYLSELTVRDASGKKIQVKNVPIRMANGKIKSLPPGKSGSSGGGGDGGQ
jgi:hypothetical protein